MILCNCMYCIKFIMSKQLKSQRIRTSSARPFSATLQRQRPSSGHPGQNYHRKDLIQNTYSPASYHSRPLTPKTVIVRQMSTLYDADKPKKSEAKIYKPKQVMAEEIVNLKLKINDLVTELGHQRGKNQQLRKKNHKYSRVLNVQFQNQRIWNAGIVNTHKVQGMRNMYDRLKQDYEKLKKGYNELIKNANVTKELEYIKYIEILETEMKALRSRFQKIAQNSLQLLSHENDYQTQASLHLLGETEHQYRQLSERYAKLKAKLQMTVQNLKDRNKKIDFMDRYCKELENKIRETEKRSANREKQLRKVIEEQTIAARNHESIIQDSKLQTATLRKKFEQMISIHQEEMAQAMNEKDQKIQSLIKENNYYQETIKELRDTNNKITRDIQHLNRSRMTEKVVQQLIETPRPEVIDLNCPSSSKSGTFQDIHQALSQYSSKQSEGLLSEGFRVRQTAEKRHYEIATKQRKVQHSQVNQIRQLLRLKVIGQCLPLNQLIQLLKPNLDPSIPESEKIWKQEYITMKQVKYILSNVPLSLQEEKAQLLARFIIEDVEAQHVYVDENNQNYRSIVRSIFKNILGEYPLLSSNTQLQHQYSLFLERYGANLQATLKSIEPKGKIAKKRFTDALKSIGAECSDDLVDVLLGKMSIKAGTLKELDYLALFHENSQ